MMPGLCLRRKYYDAYTDLKEAGSLADHPKSFTKHVHINDAV